MELKKLLSLFAVIGGITCKPYGAPEDACGEDTPSHGGWAFHIGYEGSPYRVLQDKVAYKPNDVVNGIRPWSIFNKS